MKMRLLLGFLLIPVLSVSAEEVTPAVSIITVDTSSTYVVEDPWNPDNLDELSTQLFQEDILEQKILKLKPGIDRQLLAEIDRALVQVGNRYHIDPILILAIAYKESRLNPRVRGLKGEYGLMQVMPDWANELAFVDKPDDLYEVETNIRAGGHILSDYIDQFKGDKKLALTAYNRGSGAVLVAIMNHRNPYNGYAEDVLSNYQRISRY